MSSARLKTGKIMGKIVFNIRKNKGNAGAVGAHIDRAPGMEHMFSNADQNRRHLNKKFEINDYCKLPLSKAINQRIADGYKGKRALRSDAVKSLGIVLTGSHEHMHKIFKNEKVRKYWLNQSYKFLADEFGQDNIVRFDLHMDERTPHVHAVIVPLTSDGRLSAREVMGNKSNLKRLRKKYATAVQRLGLQYGIENKPKSSTLSTKISDFYNLVENFGAEYQNLKKTLKTANFGNLSPKDKTRLLSELSAAVKNREITSEILEKYLAKNQGKKL